MLLNPKLYRGEHFDQASQEIMLKTIDFFESKGKEKLKKDDRERVWYDDFLQFVRENKIFYKLLTPAEYGEENCRFDTWRNCAFNEILSFYGLHYWYTWQVSVLGLGPIWMSENEAQKKRAAKLLKDGHVFAFGLSERAHGADIYSTATTLTPKPGGGYLASGEKYYIGNGNIAEMVSTFGKIKDSGDFVLFVANYRHKKYELVKNIINSQSYVADFILHDYPLSADDILSRGETAWDSALNTVNVGKYNLGWASIGIATHAFYEALNHAANRRLYGFYVTDFPHVQQLFTDAYTRLTAMKLFALRAADYMRVASEKDRRYLLFNPTMKMKVTTQGEEVINLLWEVIAAKGFESDTYFEMATRDIRALPKLEGTVHVNIALINKFMPNYFFNHQDYPATEKQDQPHHDHFLFNQGPARGLSKIRFHDYGPAYERYALPNVNIFKEQIALFKELLLTAPPQGEQLQDTDMMLSLGELFTLIVYGQLILENAAIYAVNEQLIDQIFNFMVRDFSKFALELYSKRGTSKAQANLLQNFFFRPAEDEEGFKRFFAGQILTLKDTYEMNP